MRALASRGAQIILLTQHPLTDPFLADYILDVRKETNNELITAEHVDLSSLHSIRLFATKWVDNAPPRRLDMLILCANTLTPPGGKPSTTEDGLESSWGLNYMANFHLLSILSPALRAQPPDRDVRVIMGTCSSYMGGVLPGQTSNPPGDNTTASSKKAKTQTEQSKLAPVPLRPASAYASSKLALMTFALAFQKHLSAYARPDKQPNNARVILVDPGFCRTPGMRRYLSRGSLLGLALYLLLWPLWWLILKSAEQGSQTFLFAAMEAQLGLVEGGRLIKECRDVKFMRDEITDESTQKELWQASEETIELLEKEGAVNRAKQKKQNSQQASPQSEPSETKTSNGSTSVSQHSPSANGSQSSRRSRKT